MRTSSVPGRGVGRAGDGRGSCARRRLDGWAAWPGGGSPPGETSAIAARDGGSIAAARAPARAAESGADCTAWPQTHTRLPATLQPPPPNPKPLAMAFSLPDLPYAFDALEPFIDTQTMQVRAQPRPAAAAPFATPIPASLAK